MHLQKARGTVSPIIGPQDVRRDIRKLQNTHCQKNLISIFKLNQKEEARWTEWTLLFINKAKAKNNNNLVEHT